MPSKNQKLKINLAKKLKKKDITKRIALCFAKFLR